ncbi:potassium/sodium hyperpolarization-activated cyclic nucleotide-gated channel 1-like [Drosophila obscura]|uniref:potassium/sodium hyperpolarization-activated cyclic nucleotide-gated channel 1-like n=1 Tax=Drosophila obscura TaxID=7282 RepID=UPI001BB2AE71|nr:potassium/sodium hyperpolarization-activated cyclic nucleotide-gated channel 1-like [Drosophila obscura]
MQELQKSNDCPMQDMRDNHKENTPSQEMQEKQQENIPSQEMQEKQQENTPSQEMQEKQRENTQTPEMPINKEDSPLQDTEEPVSNTHAIDKKLKNQGITKKVGMEIAKLKSMIRRTLVDCGTMANLMKRMQPILEEQLALTHVIESKFASYSNEIEKYLNTRGGLSAKVAANPRNAAKYRRHIQLLDKKAFRRQRSMICEMRVHWRLLRKIIVEQQQKAVASSSA